MFEEVGESAGVADGNNGSALSGMGADFRDGNNVGNNEFESLTVRTGLAFMTSQMSGWGEGMVDFANDGWKDLFVARSDVLDNINLLVPERRYAEPDSVIRNLGNDNFEDVSATARPDFQTPAPHRGVAFGDIDNDGRVDVVVSVLNAPVKFFHNLSGTGCHWILLNLEGTKSNRIAIGAQVCLMTEDHAQWNEVTTTVGYLGQR